MKKYILLFSFILHINTMNSMELEQENPFKKMPNELKDYLASFLPSRQCEDDGEFENRAEELKQGTIHSPIEIINTKGKTIEFYLENRQRSYWFGSTKAEYYLWRKKEEKIPKKIWSKENNDSSIINLFSFSRDHSKIIVCGDYANDGRGFLLVYDRKKNQEIFEYPLGCDSGKIQSISVTSDGKKIAYLHKDPSNLHIVDVEKEKATPSKGYVDDTETVIPCSSSSLEQSSQCPVIGFNKQGTKIILHVPAYEEDSWMPVYQNIQTYPAINELHPVISSQDQEKKKTWKEFCRENILYKEQSIIEKLEKK